MLSDFIFLSLVCIACYIIILNYLNNNNINLFQLAKDKFFKNENIKNDIKKPASKKTSSSYNISEVNDKNIKEKFISVDTDEIINEVINDVVNNKSTIKINY